MAVCRSCGRIDDKPLLVKHRDGSDFDLDADDGDFLIADTEFGNAYPNATAHGPSSNEGTATAVAAFRICVAH